MPPPWQSLKYSWLHPNLEVRRFAASQRGIFAKAPLALGELLAVFGGKVMRIDEEANADQDRAMQVHDCFVLGLGEGETEDTEYFNHSCDPNAGFRGQILLHATRAIAPNEQITFDYAMVLHGATIPYRYEFECGCGSPKCRRRVTGDDWRIPELQTRYHGYFQQYLQDKIDRLNSSGG